MRNLRAVVLGLAGLISPILIGCNAQSSGDPDFDTDVGKADTSGSVDRALLMSVAKRFTNDAAEFGQLRVLDLTSAPKFKASYGAAGQTADATGVVTAFSVEGFTLKLDESPAFNILVKSYVNVEGMKSGTTQWAFKQNLGSKGLGGMQVLSRDGSGDAKPPSGGTSTKLNSNWFYTVQIPSIAVSDVNDSGGPWDLVYSAGHTEEQLPDPMICLTFADKAGEYCTGKTQCENSTSCARDDLYVMDPRTQTRAAFSGATLADVTVTVYDYDPVGTSNVIGRGNLSFFDLESPTNAFELVNNISFRIALDGDGSIYNGETAATDAPARTMGSLRG